ncbi:MAG: GAF domain-containing protein [Chloroflexi bacterium]|nr:GAF domain-containing protein [Chloroflexota bacterium]
MPLDSTQIAVCLGGVIAAATLIVLYRLLPKQRALLRAEERFRDIIAHASDGIALYDAATMQVLEVNPAFCDLLDCQPPDAAQTILHKLFASDREALAAFHQRILRDGRATIHEQRLRQADGADGYVEVNGNRIVQNERPYVSISIHDSSERRRAEQEIQRQASEFAALYDTVGDLVAQRELPTLLRTVVDRARGLLSAPSSAMYLYDKAHGDLVLAIARGEGLIPGERLALGDGIAGRVAQTLQSLILAGDQLAPYQAQRAPYRSMTAVVAVPMIYGSDLTGVLVVNDTADAARRFDAMDAHLLSMFGAQAAVAINNTRLFEQEQSRREELSALYAMSRSLVGAGDSAQILELVARHAVERIRATFAVVIRAEGQDLVIRSEYPPLALGRDLWVGRYAPASQALALTRVLQSDVPLLFYRADADITGSERELLALDLVQSLCAVALRVDDRVLGILAIGEARNPARERFGSEKISLVQSLAEQASSALRRAELFEELEHTYLQTVLALARAVDAKDSYTHDHSERLAEMATAVGRVMGMSKPQLEDLRFGSILHDVGKIGVADAILQKPAALDDSERARMRRHPVIGAEILAPVPRLANAAKIVRHHHERWDGEGYPDGLAGEAIPLGARILTAVDSFSAIVDQRTYKDGRPQAEAVAELRQNAGTQFDPAVVDTFIGLLNENRWAS